MKTFSAAFKSVIDSVVYEPTKPSPILLQLPAEENIQIEKLEGGLYFNKRKRKNVVALQNENRVYKSSSHLSDRSKVLVIYNKVTKKVRLVHANQLELNPLRSEEDVEDEGEGEKDEEVHENEKEYNDSINDLVQAFGSTKMKNQHKLKKALEINLDSLKDYIEQNLHEIKVDESEPTALEADSEISLASLPPCNEGATDVKDVYKIRDIIPKDILELLYEPAKELIQKGSFDDKNPYFNKLLTTITKPKRKKKVALLIYLKATLDWLGMQSRIAVSTTVVENRYKLPTKVASHLIRTFSIVAKHGRLRPLSMRAKAITYGIILMLTLNDYSINVHDYRNYMICCKSRMALKKLTKLCRLLRLTPSTKEKNVWLLKLPLPAEKSAMKQNKSR